MSDTYDLTQLSPNTFEHLTNFIALKVLGNGATGFGPGADAGRDGYFSGEAPYPSQSNRWSGTWYIQSKFHKPHLSTKPQTWLVDEVKKEIAKFKDPKYRRVPPANWIISTNIEPSGKAQTGSFDKIKKLVEDTFGKEFNFDIWGGRKILDLLAHYPEAAQHYGHFLTPGNILSAIYDQVNDANAQIKDVLEYLILNQFNEQIYTKLEQAGSAADSRPKIYQLFIDLPYTAKNKKNRGLILQDIISSSANNHKVSLWHEFGDAWAEWRQDPRRSRVIILKGGPGQGKSTIGQYFAQLQRAALLLGPDAPKTLPATLEIAKEFRVSAEILDYWPSQPRIPIAIELKDFARWFGLASANSARGVLSYLAEKISRRIDQVVLPGTLKRALSKKSWFINFDGLDEVPNDVKDDIASEIIKFTNELLPSIDADVLILCSTRPQGYSGQFESLDGVTTTLSNLPRKTALECASTVVKFGRTAEESEASLKTLSIAIDSPQVRELMTTPLQSHIMAVVVRDGGRPPEKRWQLFENFYQVMKKRESLKDFPDPKISKLLRENDQLLRSIHARLGICLHARAENSEGAETTLDRKEFRELSLQATSILMDKNVEDTVDALMEATTERLVFVNTPDNSESVRFDVRQLQEFFAAEFIYSGVGHDQLRERVELICGDAHWREVIHFLISALIVTARTTELAIVIEILSKVNDGADCHNIRLFSKRMALGAILSLRLLAEGVLEQDRRVRHKFTKILEPLLASSDAAVIQTISSISHPNSLAWITECMIDNVLEYSETENIGSAISLSIVLSDTNERRKAVEKKIFASSDKYLNHVYDCIDGNTQVTEDGEETLPVQEWFILGTILLLCSNRNISPAMPLAILRRFPQKSESIVRNSKLTSVEKNALLLLLDETDDTYSGENLNITKKRKDVDFGGLSITYPDHSWLTSSIPKKISATHKPYNGHSPLIQMTQRILNFASNKTKKNFILMLNSVSAYSDPAEILPAALLAYIPITQLGEWSAHQIPQLLKLSDQEYDGFIKTGNLNNAKIHPIAADLDFTGNFNEKGEDEFFNDFPAVAINVWMGDHRGFASMGKSKLLRVAEIIEKNPKYGVLHFCGLGRVLNELPDKGERIKKSIAQLPEEDKTSFHTSPNVSPFKINIPEDVALLPVIANHFLNLSKHHQFLLKGQAHEPFTYDTKFIKHYGLSITNLKKIYKSKSHAANSRAAALVCAILLPVDKFNIEKFFNEKIDCLYLDLIAQVGVHPLLDAGINLFNRESTNFTETSKEFWGKVLHLFREDYSAHLAIQTLLRNLRERSQSPMQSQAALNKWLSYDLVSI